jgi:hypothetical protein
MQMLDCSQRCALSSVLTSFYSAKTICNNTKIFTKFIEVVNNITNPAKAVSRSRKGLSIVSVVVHETVRFDVVGV